MEFVEAAHALGIQNWRIMARHILPNTTHTIIVLVSMRVATAILIEATLSFLGLGAGYDRPTWGAMINEGKMYLQSAPWLSVFPGFAIMLTVLGLSLLGDGLRDVLDPRLRT
jgi:peptide/nickel transport system permease protein